MSGQSEGKNKARSRLTQSLLDAREDSTNESPKQIEPVKVDQSSRTPKETEEVAVLGNPNGKDDETVNLNEPRSQSGQYWKSEFENYRKKTNLEMRKLIQYRSAAKSYARKKDAEALRLAEKLREEEAKVAAMERHVTGLASNMVGGAADADKDKLVQELAKQTALAVQYKHNVDGLRKALERHGVVGSNNDQQEAENASKEVDAELRKTQRALQDANAKIEEMKQQQGDLKKLRDLAHSSERKASELEKENSSLKQILARVKQEMDKYEGRRKEKEAKLKQREAKLETKNQEYREKLKTMVKEHREAEEALKISFHDERKGYQEQIQALRSKIASVERFARPGYFEEAAYSPRKDYAGVEVHDFGAQHGHHNIDYNNDLVGSPSPNSRKQLKYYSQRTNQGFQDPRGPVGGGAKIPEDAEPLIWFDDSPGRPFHRRSHTVPGNNDTLLFPSSPPELPATFENRQLRHASRPLISPRPTMFTFPAHTADREDELRTRQRHPSKKGTSESLQQLVGGSPGHMVLESSRVRLDSLSPDRVAAAKARLRQKEESRRIKGDGKENIGEILA
jgi:hypothetical protein